MLIHGHPAPVVYKIRMDMLTVNVTDVPDIRAGMTATLIGWDGNSEITAPMTAKALIVKEQKSPQAAIAPVG